MKLRISKIKHQTLIIFLLLAILLKSSAISICFDLSNICRFVLLILIVLFIFINKGKISLKLIKKNSTALFLILTSLPSFIKNFSFIGFSQWESYFTAVLYAFFLVLVSEKKQLFKTYVKVMFYISIFSLICYMLFVITGLPVDWMPLITKTTDSNIQYRSLILYNIWTTEFTRNCGPFWEPSIYAAYLVFALILRLFWLEPDKNSKIEIIILFITIISTSSTGGYILLLLTILMYIWKRQFHSFIAIIITLSIALIIVFFGQNILNWLVTINYDIFIKITEFKTMGTTTTRMVSIATNLAIWINNIFVGVGFGGIDAQYEIWKMIIGGSALDAAQTSTTFLFLGSLGIFGIYYTYVWIKAAICTKRINIVQKILFLIIIFFILNQTPHTYFILTYYLLFSFLNDSCNFA